MNPNDQLGLILALLSMREQMPSTSDPQPMPGYSEMPMDMQSIATRSSNQRRDANASMVDASLRNNVDPRMNWVQQGDRYTRDYWDMTEQDRYNRALLEAMFARVPPGMSTIVGPSSRTRLFPTK